MTPFWAFVIGALCGGTVLTLVFGALHLDAEEEAYWQGYGDGLGKVHEEAKKAVENEKNSY